MLRASLCDPPLGEHSCALAQGDVLSLERLCHAGIG
jgi:hypothetical protein